MTNASPPSLAPGARLGRYRIERVLGEGSFSTVYLAHDTTLDLDVGIKVLHPDVNEGVVARFRREIVFSRRIAHPGICRVFDLHEDGALKYLTMEHIEGTTLASAMNHGVMPVRRALHIARGLADAASAAHDVGVVHCDLKPGNVMLRAREPLSGTHDAVVVLDFGAATVGVDPSRRGNAVGSPHYLAPEVWKGEAPTAQSDLYAIGVILYGCLTGQLPYGAHDVVELVLQIRHSTPVAPSALQRDIPPEVDDVVARAMAVEPAQRFADARALMGALDDARRAVPLALGRRRDRAATSFRSS
jgi:serine/threonine protein kinase